MLVLVAVAGIGATARADDASDARRHAQRASALAASGKCKQAVAEFDKAMAILRDPALLFNRGECHRKLGDNEAALEDYRQFLSDLPKAPNRAAVEKRIAELTHKTSGAAAAPVAAPPSVRPPVTRTPVEATPSSVKPAEVVGPRVVTAPSATKPAGGSRAIILAPPPPSESASTEAPGTTLATTAEEKAPPSASERGITSRPWFWIALAAVAVGAGVGTFVVLNRDSTSVPSSALGNYKF